MEDVVIATKHSRQNGVFEAKPELGGCVNTLRDCKRPSKSTAITRLQTRMIENSTTKFFFIELNCCVTKSQWLISIFFMNDLSHNARTARLRKLVDFRRPVNNGNSTKYEAIPDSLHCWLPLGRRTIS